MPDSGDRAKYGPALEASGGLFNVTVNFDKNQRIHWDSLIHLYTGTVSNTHQVNNAVLANKWLCDIIHT